MRRSVVGLLFLSALLCSAASLRGQLSITVTPIDPPLTFTPTTLAECGEGAQEFLFRCFFASQGNATFPAAIQNFDPATGGLKSFPMPPSFGTPTPFISGLVIDANGGSVWFTGIQGSQSFVANLVPSGAVAKITNNVTAAAFAGASHVGMAVGPDGTVYYCEPGIDAVGEINPTTGQITEFRNPSPAQLQDLTAGNDGTIYLSNFGGSSSSGGILRFNPATGAFTSISIPQIGSASSHPGFMTRNGNGTIFFTDSGQNGIGEIAPSSGVITVHPIPTPNSDPLGIATGQDGNVYFTEGNSGKLGYLNDTLPTPGEIPGLGSHAVLFLSQGSALASGAKDSFVGVVPGNTTGEQVERIDVASTNGPCNPPLTITYFSQSITLQAGKSQKTDIPVMIEGGTAPFGLASVENLPPGLFQQISESSANGWAIAGSPTTPGSYVIKCHFFDENDCLVQATLVITVLPSVGPPCKPAQEFNLADLCMLLLAGAEDRVAGTPSRSSAQGSTEYRFWLTLSAVDPRTGNVGLGQAIPQKDEFGYFSLPSFTGDATFPEVMVKMVDARSFTCCFWLFHTGLTDLQYTLTVFDTQSGGYKQYQNDRSDPTRLCGGADTDTFNGVTSGPLAATLPPALLSTESPQGEPFAAVPEKATVVPEASASCVAGTNTICLLGNRFSATLSATDPRTGHVGVGQAIPQKDEFGYFSLPSFTGDATFPEVFVKMVDARSFTCCFWVFHSGLTDLEYTLTITDTTNGAQHVYHNDRSNPNALCGGADTTAFH